MTDDTVFYTGASCPHCGKSVPHAGDVKGEAVPPIPGDACICIKCGEWAIFTNDMQMRKPTRKEAREMADDPNVQEADARWRRMQQ